MTGRELTQSLEFHKKWLAGERGLKISFLNEDLDYEDLSNLNLCDVNFTDSTIKNTDFQNSGLIDSNFIDATIEGCSFENANLARVNFFGAKLKNVSFKNCNLMRAKFRNAELDNVDFSGANLRWADFIRVDLSKADFRGANIENCAIPLNQELSGIQYDDEQIIDFLNRLAESGKNSKYVSTKTGKVLDDILSILKKEA